MPNSETEEILKRAEDTLDTARMGLEIYNEQDGRRRLSGLRNFVTFGRSVTFVLQNLKSVEEGFEDWYSKYLEEMKEDPLMEYFDTLRNEILKEGKLEHTPAAYIEELSTESIRRDFPPPPGATKLVIGDAQDGNSSYWLVDKGDGETEKFYIDPPGVETTYHPPDPPEFHLGEKIRDDSVANLAACCA